MTLGQSVSSVFKKYAIFSGRASRSEYWYFYLFNVLMSMAIGFVAGLITGMTGVTFTWLVYVWSIAVFIPNLAVAVRRYHDSNHSGWWLICPIVNIILLFYASDEGANDYGVLEEDEPQYIA